MCYHLTMARTITAALVLLLVVIFGAAAEVNTSLIWHNETNAFNPWGLGEGARPMEVRISELFRKKYTVIANTVDPQVKVVFACYPGYRKVQNRICKPTCDKPCRNGKCVGPNDCRCFFGFVMSLNGDCVTTCPFECLNGQCDEFGGCKCNPGFQLDQTKNFCIPLCNNNCGLNGNCTAPNHCGCSKGYQMNFKTLQCEAVCDPPCGSGACVAPGQCHCDSGFRVVDNTCQANCSRGCENGRCVAEERCKCDFGWALHSEGNKCSPVCKRGCKNGICVGADKCKCDKGYKKPFENSNLCKPRCEPACINGVCVGPNVCRCNQGYYHGLSEYDCKRVRVRLPGIRIRLPKVHPSGSLSPPLAKQLPSGKDVSSEEEFSTIPNFTKTIYSDYS